MAGPSANTLEALEDFQIRWETTINRCNDLSHEETYTGLINKLLPARKKIIEDKRKKMHRQECWVNHVGARVNEDTIAHLIDECCENDPRYRISYTSNSTIVKFISEGSDFQAAKLISRASSFVAPGGEPYKFTKMPVTMSISAVWSHPKSEMAGLSYARSTRNALNGRLNDDKRPDGKTSLGRPQEHNTQTYGMYDALRLMITLHVEKPTWTKWTTSETLAVTDVENQAIRPQIARRRRTCATIFDGRGT